MAYGDVEKGTMWWLRRALKGIHDTQGHLYKGPSDPRTTLFDIVFLDFSLYGVDRVAVLKSG